MLDPRTPGYIWPDEPHPCSLFSLSPFPFFLPVASFTSKDSLKGRMNLPKVKTLIHGPSRIETHPQFPTSQQWVFFKVHYVLRQWIKDLLEIAGLAGLALIQSEGSRMVTGIVPRVPEMNNFSRQGCINKLEDDKVNYLALLSSLSPSKNLDTGKGADSWTLVWVETPPTPDRPFQLLSLGFDLGPKGAQGFWAWYCARTQIFTQHDVFHAKKGYTVTTYIDTPAFLFPLAFNRKSQLITLESSEKYWQKAKTTICRKYGKQVEIGNETWLWASKLWEKRLERSIG